MTIDRLDNYVRRIVFSGNRIISYVDGLDRDAFHGDEIRQDAVVANIMAIGECVAKILEQYPDFAAAHQNIPWRDIRNMRNRIAHQYFQLDIDTVWLAETVGVPDLVGAIDKISPDRDAP